MLIAYENGLLVLFDIAESRVLFVGGASDLLLKGSNADSTSQLENNLIEDTTEHCLGEKEISALCWASCDGSILAVGYVDGDILFWNTSRSYSRKHEQPNLPSNNVVRVRVSSAERRLPVIVLQWSSIKKCQECNGFLFIYGGDQIGAEEVLTVSYVYLLTYAMKLSYILQCFLHFGFYPLKLSFFCFLLIFDAVF